MEFVPELAPLLSKKLPTCSVSALKFANVNRFAIGTGIAPVWGWVRLLTDEQSKEIVILLETVKYYPVILIVRSGQLKESG